MVRCHFLTVAALIAVGSPPQAVGQWCRSAEEPPAATSALDTLRFERRECATSGSQSQWPPTWEIGPDVTLRLRGRIDLDSIWSSQSPANQATFGDLQDVVGFRRARIGIEGELGLDGRYVAEFDLPTGVVVPRDVYLAFGSPHERGERRFGHFREPFSLEGGTSARFFAFMERSPVNMLDPARNWGIGLFHESLDATSAWGLGIFHAGVDPWNFQGGEGSTVGLTGRLTTALVNERDGERLLHLGIALSERIPENGVIVFNQQPRSSLLQLADSSTSPFVPEIRVPANFQQLINLQFAAANGSLWAQAEWYGSLVDQTGGGLVFFHGYHVDCGYFLTGEHRAYHAASGTLGEVRVQRPLLRGPADGHRQRGWGAWELAARITDLDLLDSDTPTGPGGERLGVRLPLSTVGVNWYLSDRVRVMFNYSHAVPDQFHTAAGTANVFSTRLAMYW